MNQMTSWGAPGCPPSSCFDPAALLGCYSDIQALTVLINQIVQNLAATDPTFQKSLVDAIVSSGSNIPLIGVTNGSAAKPGQVGEYIEQNWSTPVTGAPQTFNIPGIVLQPGDWTLQASAYMDGWPTGIMIYLNPQPPGFSNGMFGIAGSVTNPGTGAGFLTAVSPRAQGLVSVPTLVPFTMQVNFEGTGVAGVAVFTLSALRVR